MRNDKIHIVWVMANNSSVPYFNWFAGRAKDDERIRISFICLFPTRPKMIDEMNALGIACHWRKFDERKRKRGFVRLVPQLYFLLRKIKPDVVHSHLFDDSLPALFAARLACIKMRVITKADASYHYYFHPRLFRFDLFNNRNATHIVAISEESKEFILSTEKAPPGKVTLIHHGIPLEVITRTDPVIMERLRDRFDTNGRTVVGTVSRFIEWKGYRYIVDAAEKLIGRYPDLLFLFAGRGDQEKEIMALVASKGLESHIQLTGWIDRDEMPSFYSIMDIYVHAASREPFGFVIAEAMANGTPVVSTRTGAARDAIIHKESGYLAKDRNADDLANGISFMMENDRKKIGTAGAEQAKRMYSFEQMYNSHIALYLKDSKA